MCGIAAILRRDGTRADVADLARMASAQRHRGPVLGSVLSLQILHDRLVERAPECDATFPLVRREASSSAVRLHEAAVAGMTASARP